MSELARFDLLLHLVEVVLALGIFGLTVLIAGAVRRQAGGDQDKSNRS